MTPIATQTLTANASTVVFTGVPQTYTDLVLVSVFGASVGMDIYVRFNGDSNSNYSTVRFFGNGTDVYVSRADDSGIQPRTSVNQASTVTTILKENIMNYTNTAIFKPVVGRYDYSGQVETHAGLWRNTAAITSVSMVSIGQAFVTGSTFTLYGIKAA
jgi:hypothetical protein